MEASCQCGRSKIATPSSEPLCVYICHCTECRRQSGSAFGVSVIFPKFNLDPASEYDIRKWSRQTLTGKTMNCYFCGSCGSRLMHAREGVDNVSIKGGCLKGLTKAMMTEAIHIWTSEAVVPIPDGAKQYAQEEPDEPGADSEN